MKIAKILIILFFFILTTIRGSSQVSDTTQYLIDSIQPKASYYVGKPFKILLDNLKIKVVYCLTIPLWDKRLKDTIQFSEILLEFYSSNELTQRMGLHIKSPAIHIKFSQSIPIPKAWLMHGGRFEKDDWDLQKERFFRNFIVGEIAIRGI